MGDKSDSTLEGTVVTGEEVKAYWPVWRVLLSCIQ